MSVKKIHSSIVDYIGEENIKSNNYCEGSGFIITTYSNYFIQIVFFGKDCEINFVNRNRKINEKGRRILKVLPCEKVMEIVKSFIKL